MPSSVKSATSLSSTQGGGGGGQDEGGAVGGAEGKKKSSRQSTTATMPTAGFTSSRSRAPKIGQHSRSNLAQQQQQHDFGRQSEAETSNKQEANSSLTEVDRELLNIRIRDLEEKLVR